LRIAFLGDSGDVHDLPPLAPLALADLTGDFLAAVLTTGFLAACGILPPAAAAFLLAWLCVFLSRCGLARSQPNTPLKHRPDKQGYL
jgi:hypothetical protein